MNMESSGMDIRLDAVLETPIIVLPRADRSNEVLVGHLGLITIRNETFRGFLVDRTDQVHISIENMNEPLYVQSILNQDIFAFLHICMQNSIYTYQIVLKFRRLLS